MEFMEICRIHEQQFLTALVNTPLRLLKPVAADVSQETQVGSHREAVGWDLGCGLSQHRRSLTPGTHHLLGLFMCKPLRASGTLKCTVPQIS